MMMRMGLINSPELSALGEGGQVEGVAGQSPGRRTVKGKAREGGPLHPMSGGDQPATTVPIGGPCVAEGDRLLQAEGRTGIEEATRKPLRDDHRDGWVMTMSKSFSIGG